jgi:hypothetical protein
MQLTQSLIVYLELLYGWSNHLWFIDRDRINYSGSFHVTHDRGYLYSLPESGPFPVLDALSSAFCRALGKEPFAECRTRQSPVLSNELVYRA